MDTAPLRTAPAPAPIPAYLPSEPPPPDRSIAGALRHLLPRLGLLLLSLPALIGWAIWLPLSLILPRPPHLPPATRFLSVGRAILVAADHDRGEDPPLSPQARLSLALSLSLRWLWVGAASLAWHLDGLLYGRRLATTEIRAPLIELSAARSGSTQLAHYLEEDPRICAPSLLQALLPYRWLWRLVEIAARAIAPLRPADRLRAQFEALFPPEYVERHELDPFGTDTFEVIFQAHHLLDLELSLHPGFYASTTPARLTAENRAFWDDFLAFFDAIGRKTLLHAGSDRRLLIKGHFLAVADALEARYPGARMLTVIRAPDKRVQSVINFHRCQPHDPLAGPAPWSWLVGPGLAEEIAYCEEELRWHQRPAPAGTRRCLIRFDDYLRDLEGTMRLVYRACLDADDLPPHVPTAHAERLRSGYRIDRSLLQLNLDPADLKQRLAAYTAWCRPSAARPTPAR